MDQIDQICESLSTFGFNESELRDIIEEVSPCERYVRFNQYLDCSELETTFKGLDTEVGREIFWHILPQRAISEERMGKLEECICSAKVNPNVLTLYDLWINKEEQTIVMITECASRLKDYLKKIDRPWLRIIKVWGLEILNGLYQLLQPIRVILDDLFIDTFHGHIKIGIRRLLEISNEEVQLRSFGMCLLEIAVHPFNTKTNLLQILDDDEVKEVVLQCLECRTSIQKLAKNPFFELKDSPRLTKPIPLNSNYASSNTIIEQAMQGDSLGISVNINANGKMQNIKFVFDLKSDSVGGVAEEMAEALELNLYHVNSLVNVISDKINETIRMSNKTQVPTQRPKEFESMSSSSECDSPDKIYPEITNINKN